MWCISEVNFPPFSRSAAWRIRSSACLTRARPCIRCMSRCSEFPLTRPLLSTASATGRPALFGRFFDTTGLSDSSGLCIVGFAVRLPSAPQIAFDRGEAGGLPDSSTVCPHMHGVSDPGWPQPVSHNDVLNVAFRLPRRRRHHRLEGFRGSTPSLCVPLSTLRLQPRDYRRMTQGRGGLLGLPRMALSSTTLLLAHWRFPELNRFTCVRACRSPDLRFAVIVTSHSARLGFRWLAGPGRRGNLTLWIHAASSGRTLTGKSHPRPR